VLHFNINILLKIQKQKIHFPLKIIKPEKKLKDHLKNHQKKNYREIGCKQYNVEELQDIFDKKQNSEQLNKIMSVIIDKQGILSYDYEKTNNSQLEEEIYQEMKLIKLEDLNILPLEEARKILDKKF